MSPVHLANDINVLSGRCRFNNSKLSDVYFLDRNGNQVSFTRAPFVSLTLDDQTAAPPFRYSWIKNNNLFIGCRIKFNANYTGNIDWQVSGEI